MMCLICMKEVKPEEAYFVLGELTYHCACIWPYSRSRPLSSARQFAKSYHELVVLGNDQDEPL